MRIISTVPSLTELLYDLGLGEQVIGITKFCVHPQEWYRHKTRIGGTKNLRIDQIHELKPDLIIANKEENTREDIEQLNGYEVFVSEVKTLEDNLRLIENISYLTNSRKQGHEIASAFEKCAEDLYGPVFTEAIYFIWRNPFMSVGADSYIHSMMHHIGIRNLLDDKTRYPEISESEIKSLDPDLLLFSSEPFPFKDKDMPEYEKQFPGSKALVVDGEFFSWYGSRLLHMKDYGLQLMEKLRKAVNE